MVARNSFGAFLVLGAMVGCGSSSTPEPVTPAAPEVESAAPAAAPSTPSAAGSATCEQPLLDDLEDGNNQGLVVDNRGGYWFSFKDNAGSTLTPEGNFMPAAGGADGSKHAAHIAGKTGSAGVVYTGMGFNLSNPMAPYDLSGAKGICFKAKGTGSARVKVPDVNTTPEGGVCKTCYNDFGADFQLTPDWTEHCFAFADMKQQPGWGEPHPALTQTKAFSIQWQVSTPNAEYDVWVDDVRLMCE